ncbi:MAG: hypothetical protein ABI064_02895, partial [Acidobacteriaceae bacterium]
MSESDLETGQVKEAEEVPGVVFPSGDEAAEALHPAKELLDFSAYTITAQRASILACPFATAPVTRDHLDATFVFQVRIRRIRVVGIVADEPHLKFIEEISGQNLFQKLALGRRSALQRYGERKTVMSGAAMAFVPLPRRVGRTTKAPFSHWRRSNRRTPRPDSVCPAHAGVASAGAAPLPVFRWVATVVAVDGGSGTEEFLQQLARLRPRLLAPRTLRSPPSAWCATDVHPSRFPQHRLGHL